MIHVGPEAYGAGEILPHSLVLPDTFLTLLDKRLQTVLLDLILSVQAQLLFHFQLDRKSVGIPAGLSWNHISLHGSVSGDHILKYTGLNMADMRFSVGSWRSVIKHIRLASFTHLDALFKNVFICPELFYFFFPFYKL